jgi:hypothetical protein
MTLSDFKAKLNWRLILVHMAASWFFFHAFYILSVLRELPLFNAIIHHSNTTSLGSESISYAFLWMALGGYIGILTPLAISLFISKYRHWYWVNSLLAFLLAYLLCRFDFAWHYLKNIFLTPGDLFHTLMWQLITNGSIMLAIGLLLLFLNGVVRFIDGRRKVAEGEFV